MSKIGRFVAACAAVAVGLGASGLLNAADTTVRRTVAATEGAPLAMPAGFGSQNVTLHWIPGIDSAGFVNVFNNGPDWESGSVTISGSCCPFNSKTKLNDPNLGTLFVGKHTYFCALYLKPADGAQTSVDSAVYVSDCGSNVLTEEGWIFFTITKSNQYGYWFKTTDIASGANAAATLTYAYAIDLTQMQADGLLDDISLGNCMNLFARRELKPGQNGATMTRPKEGGKIVQSLTVASATGTKVYRHVDGTGTASLTVSAGETLAVDNGSVAFRADMPVEANRPASDWSPYRWAAIGDSLTDPTLNPVGGKYYDILAASTGIRTFVNGKGSTGYWALNESGLAFCQRLLSLPADVDVVTIFGSVNDWKYYQKSVPVGTVADRLPTASVCAYVNAAIDEVQKRAPLAKIILCTGLYYYGVGSQYHGNANKAVVDVAAARGIECHDWLNGQNAGDLDFHNINRDTGSVEFAQKYTRDYSATASSYGHPSAAYNEEWLAPAFSNLLKTAIANLESKAGEPVADAELKEGGEGQGEGQGEEVTPEPEPHVEPEPTVEPEPQGEPEPEPQGEPEPEPQGEPEPVVEDAIYVDCNAEAGGDGTKDKPFQTIAEGVAAAGTDGKPTLVLVAEGTYPLSAMLTVNKAITVRGAGMDKTILNGQGACRGISISVDGAVVENLKVYNCYSSAKADGVCVAISAGTLRNCRVTKGVCASHSGRGYGIYLSGTAQVVGCLVEQCKPSTSSKSATGVAVYLNGANTLMKDTIVTNNRLDRNYGGNAQTGMVRVDAGTVRNCTITGNRTYRYSGLQLADSANAKVYDTISWGNEDWEGGNALAPNLNAGAKAVVERVCSPVASPNDPSPITDDPLFVDAENGDFSLRPSSPCIEHQVGAIPYDTTKPAFGLAATKRQGVNELETTLSVVGFGGAEATAVAWTVDGVEAGSDAELVKTFGPGFHTVSATVTGAGDPVTVTEDEFVKVYASEVFVDAQSANPVAPYTTAATAAKKFDDAYPYLATNGMMRVAPGTYTFTKEYYVRTPQKFLGENRETTILKPLSQYRHFNLSHKEALLAGVKVTGGAGGTSRYGSALYVSAGVVSNCWVYNNSLSTGNLHGGAMYMDGADARITRSVLSENKITGGSGSKGLAIYMTNGTVDNCLFTNNTTAAGNRTGFQGGGVYMSGGKVLNCTFANNSCGQGPGVYATGGTVANTILYGNTALGEGDANWGGTSSCFVNCCSVNAVGSGFVPVTDAPYQADYTLALGSPCIDQGDNSYLAYESETDYFGEERLLGEHVDIGASEYRPSETMSASVACSPQTSLPGDAVVAVASVEGQGVVPEQCVYAWKIDGMPIAETGAIFTNTFAVGRHTVELTVTFGDKHAEAEPATVTVFPKTVYVAAAGTQEFPYDTPANAFTNFAEAVETAVSGMTVHVGEGRWRIYGTIVLDANKNLKIVGDGMDKTTIYRSGGSNFRLFEMNADGSLLSDLALTGGVGDGGGVYAHNGGGTVERCLIYDCSSGPNSDGGGVNLSGSASVIRYSILSNNTATISSGQLRGGGGVKLDYGAVCENCLIVNNKGQGGAGALLGENGSSRLSNCTLIGNHCESNRTDYVGGAVYAQAGTVENCIVLGSYDNMGSVNPHVKGGKSRYFNCFLPIDYSDTCVTGTVETVGFTNNYCFGAFSPCVRK